MDFIQKIADRLKEKWQHAGFQKYLQNFSWMLVGRMFTLAVAFFVNIYMARYLGPGNYGILNYAISFVALFDFISSLGVENIVSREIIKNYEKKDAVIGTSFYLRLIGSVLAFVLVIVTSIVTTDDLFIRGLLWMLSLNYLLSPLGIIDSYFKSQAMSKLPTILIIVANSISALFKIGVMYFHGGVIWLTASYVLETAILSVGLLYLFIRLGHHFKNWVFDKSVARTIMKDSWPLILSSVAVGIYLKIDQVMIKNILGNEQAGIYAVSAKLAEFWYFIPSAVCAAVFPAIVNAKKTSLQLYKNRLLKLYSVLFWLSLVIAVVTTFFAHFIINLLFGELYIGAVASLKIYIWAGVGISLGYGLSYYLIAENTTTISMISTICGSVTNIMLNIILIPRYGINGAAFASFISYTLVLFISLAFKRTRSQLYLILRSILPFA